MGAYQEMCRDGFPGDASAIPLQVELQHFYSITPSSFSSRNYHIPAHLGRQLWGEVGFTQAEKISGSVKSSEDSTIQDLPLSPQDKFPLVNFPAGKEHLSITHEAGAQVLGFQGG